jgi:hypothetical protein
VVPIVQDYYNAGEFTFKGKLWFAVKANAKLYAVAAILALIIGISLYASGVCTPFYTTYYTYISIMKRSTNVVLTYRVPQWVVCMYVE